MGKFMMGGAPVAALVAVVLAAAMAPSTSWAQYKNFEDACAGETDALMVKYSCDSYLAERTASGRKLAWALSNRGWGYFNTSIAISSNEYYGPALADFEAALKIDPKSSYALYGRGMTKLKRGDTAGGNADIAAATKLQADIARQFEKPMKR
jgi:hypothetical protein